MTRSMWALGWQDQNLADLRMAAVRTHGSQGGSSRTLWSSGCQHKDFMGLRMTTVGPCGVHVAAVGPHRHHDGSCWTLGASE